MGAEVSLNFLVPLYRAAASVSLRSTGVTASVKAIINNVEGVSRFEVCRRVALISGARQVRDDIANEVRGLLVGCSSS